MPERSNLERDLFNAALERTTPAHRAALLDGTCGSDAALRARAEAQLRAAVEGGRTFAGRSGPTVGRDHPHTREAIQLQQANRQCVSA